MSKPQFPIPAVPRALLLALAIFTCTCALFPARSALAQSDADAGAIHALLDGLHAAAAAADRERYLDHFAENAVFMGTDDWERWPLEEFRTYVAERFAGGTGWTYVPQDRHLASDPTGDTVWFDEIAVSPRWGRFRGTGVVVRTGSGWKIAHYSLTALVPNERFADVAAVASEGFAERDAKAAEETQD